MFTDILAVYRYFVVFTDNFVYRYMSFYVVWLLFFFFKFSTRVVTFSQEMTQPQIFFANKKGTIMVHDTAQAVRGLYVLAQQSVAEAHSHQAK